MELERWYDPRDLGKVKITNESIASHLEENIKRDQAFLGEKELAMEALMIMIERFKGSGQSNTEDEIHRWYDTGFYCR